MPYERRVDRDHPSCFVFLVDQSYSMLEPVAGNPEMSKAQALADALNGLMYELVLRCVKDPSEGPRHYYDIGVIGYGQQVGPVLGGALAGRDLVSIGELAHNPLRVEERVRSNGQRSQVDQSTVERTIKFPVWFDAVASGGTPMSAAIDRCGAMLAPWVQQHPESFPPIIINISDGAATDGDPLVWAERLQSLGTNDGHVLMFNVNISAKKADPIFFASDEDQLPDKYAQQLFRLSSTLPGFMCELAGMQGYSIQPRARGFVFNADISSVISFLQIGTSTHHIAD